MDVRAQISMVFHLDKCIGCHTCSVACKNIWTDRKGTEYMWWNNVETKPGTGYPTLWEDQDQYRGGWEISNGQPRLRATGRLRGLTNIFFNPYMANLDDYYEPWTYRYNDLFNSPAGEDQPTARPISKITGKELEIEAGPNWDDDLGGSNIYAANDPNVKNLSDAEKQELFELDRMFYFYVPRICNHCLNPGCVAACPSGAAYKRGEDGIVLINQDKCRGWRFCVSGCPYKKAYYNWNSGKSEKCILCFPRIEAGKPPACFHSCPGRIRFLGVILYDADRIVDTVSVPDDKLVDAQRDIILDPFDEKVVEAAMANGISDDVIDAARRSPVYKFVKEWSLALPLHSEFRTIPNLFYVPPLLPAMASTVGGPYKQAAADYFGSVESSRVPVRYLAGLLSAGNEEIVTSVLKKLIAIRAFMRFDTVGDIEGELVNGMLADAGLTPEAVREIVKLSALAGIRERYVVPPSHREMNIEELMGEPLPEAERYSGHAGFGAIKPPKRGP